MNEQLSEALARLPSYLGGHVAVSIAALLLGLAISLPLALLAVSLAIAGAGTASAASDASRAKPAATPAANPTSAPPTVALAVSGRSTTGISAIIDGTAQIGMSSRRVKPTEVSAAGAKGISMKPTVVAFDGIAVIVNKDNPPAQQDAVLVSRLKAAGAVLLGGLNMDEYAYGFTTENSHYGPTRNPHDPGRIAGGSSGGSAAAVAAHLALGSTGTDTGGSIRQPAAFTGIVGIKPTYGRCSRWGIVAFASSLDQAGPFTKTVRDAAILLRSMAGHDPKDTTSVDRPVPNYEEAIGKSVKGMRIGIPKEYRVDGMPAEIEKLWQQGQDWLKSAGAELVEVSLPHTKYALPAYYIVAPAEASSNLARYDGVRYGLRVPDRDIIGMYEKTRAEGFGKEVRRRIMIGTYVLSAGYYDAYYLRAQKVRTLIKKDFEDCFAQGIHAGYAVYFPELFPTHLRATGAGFCFNTGRILAAPVLIWLSAWMKSTFALPVAVSVLGGFFLLGLVVLRFLPETKDQSLPEG